MGRLTDNMSRLREEIDSSHNICMEFVSGLRENVGEMRAGFQEDNLRTAKETKAKLRAFVSDLRENVGEMRAGFQKDNSNRKENVGEVLAGFQEDNLKVAKETKAKLRAFVSDLRENVGEMRAGFQKDNSNRKENVGEVLAGFQEDNLKVAKETKAKLGAFVSGLRENVGEMRAGFQADMTGARRAWTGSSPAKPKVMEETAPRVEVENEAVEPQTMEETSEEVIRDDLTLIQGIGKGMQERLNAAGIYTFVQLAESTPDDLRRNLGKSARMAEVEKWIEQARPGGELA